MTEKSATTKEPTQDPTMTKQAHVTIALPDAFRRAVKTTADETEIPERVFMSAAAVLLSRLAGDALKGEPLDIVRQARQVAPGPITSTF